MAPSSAKVNTNNNIPLKALLLFCLSRHQHLVEVLSSSATTLLRVPSMSSHSHATEQHQSSSCVAPVVLPPVFYVLPEVMPAPVNFVLHVSCHARQYRARSSAMRSTSICLCNILVPTQYCHRHENMIQRLHNILSTRLGLATSHLTLSHATSSWYGDVSPATSHLTYPRVMTQASLPWRRESCYWSCHKIDLCTCYATTPSTSQLTTHHDDPQKSCQRLLLPTSQPC